MSTEQKQGGRSLPWFRVDNDSVDHPKVDALAEKLDEPLALAYVIRLWAWTMRYAARGRLAPGARLSVERACGWRGQPGALWSALVETGWIDLHADGSAEVHDWDEHQGAAVAKAEKDANRKRENRKRLAGGAETARAGRAVGAGNGTERDETERSSSYEDDGAPPPSPGVRFFEWFQTQRGEDGYAREESPPKEKLDEFFAAASMKLQDTPEGTAEALQVATRGFGKDPFWAERAYPWAGFVEQWARHVRKPRRMLIHDVEDGVQA